MTIDPTLIVDGKAPCEFCGGYYTVSANGSLRKHACTGVDNGVDGAERVEVHKPATKTARAKGGTRASKTKPPDAVTRLVVAAVATAIEFSSKRMLASAVDLPARVIPDEVVELSESDSDDMIKPILNAAWPKMPDRARKGLISLAEHEDLIACGFAWKDYFTRMRKFTDAIAAERKALTKTNPTPTAIEGIETGHVVQEQATGTDGSSIQFEPITGFEPFVPLAESIL